MVNFILGLGAFLLEWFLGWALLVLLYIFFRRYILTRYLIAYPGMLLILNVAGWITAFCIYLLYAIGGTFHSSFIEDLLYQEVQERTGRYILSLEKALKASTVLMTLLGLFFIVGDERSYWQTRRQKGANP
jgi:hypothetical protein